MRLIAVAILLSSCALAQTGVPAVGCGPQDVAFTVSADKSQHPTPAPPEGEAVLYVFGTNRFPGWGFEGDLGVDGRWVGAVTRGRDYFVLPISPGEHHLCARVVSRTGPFLIPALKTDDTSNYFLRTKPGETYYLTLRVGRHSGFLQLLDPDKGKRLLASSTFTTSRIK